IGRSGIDLNIYVNPDDRAELVRRLREQGAVRDYETTVRTKSGQLREVLCSLEVIELDGEVCNLSIMFDITDRKRAEAAVRQSEERFAKAFRASPVAMAITRVSDNCFSDANERFCHMLDYSREEMIGRSSLDLNMLANPADRAERVRIIRERGSLRDFETIVRTKSGELRAVLFSVEAIELAGEQYYLTSLVDISDR